MDSTLNLRMHALVLRVRNLEHSRTWYTEMLGLRVVFEDRHYKLYVMRDDGESQIAIWELRSGEAPTRATKESAYPIFISTNAKADQRELTQRGANPGPVEDDPHGLRMFWLTDPDGHRVLVLEFLME